MRNLVKGLLALGVFGTSLMAINASAEDAPQRCTKVGGQVWCYKKIIEKR